MHAKATEVAEVWFDAANATDMTAERKWSPDFVADKNTAERRAVRKPRRMAQAARLWSAGFQRELMAKDKTMDLTDAEQQLIELMRHDQRFAVTINRDGNLWHIRLEDPESGKSGIGTGHDFERAWDRVAQPGLINRPTLRVVSSDEEPKT